MSTFTSFLTGIPADRVDPFRLYRENIYSYQTLNRLPYDPVQAGVLRQMGQSVEPGTGFMGKTGSDDPYRVNYDPIERGIQKLAPKNATAQPNTGTGTELVEGGSGVLQWKDLLNTVSNESGVPASVLAAIMENESGGVNPPGPSSTGDYGLMQVNPTWWQEVIDDFGGNVLDPATNIRVGAHSVSTG
jgi:soluble lytic murein transglycosylase-like protein